MQNKYKIGLAVVAICLSFGAGYFAKPAKTVEVIKKEVVTEEAKTKVIYKERITKPDGTITEIEKSKEDTNTKTDAKESIAKTVENRIGLTIQGLYYAPINSFKIAEYGVIVSKRVFSNVTVGAMATTDKKIGLTLGLEF